MSNLDVSHTIVAKSDQLNAVDLTQSETIVNIIDVKVSEKNNDQPVSIHLSGYDGRPYKPCLSMRRILVNAWGKDAGTWIGQSMAIYCENSVRWAGKDVGGIRISKLTGISKEVSAPIAINRSLREIYTVYPLEVVQPDWAAESLRITTEIMALETIEALDSYKDNLKGLSKRMPKDQFDKVIESGAKKRELLTTEV